MHFIYIKNDKSRNTDDEVANLIAGWDVNDFTPPNNELLDDLRNRIKGFLTVDARDAWTEESAQIIPIPQANVGRYFDRFRANDIADPSSGRRTAWGTRFPFDFNIDTPTDTAKSLFKYPGYIGKLPVAFQSREVQLVYLEYLRESGNVRNITLFDSPIPEIQKHRLSAVVFEELPELSDRLASQQIETVKLASKLKIDILCEYEAAILDEFKPGLALVLQNTGDLGLEAVERFNVIKDFVRQAPDEALDLPLDLDFSEDASTPAAAPTSAAPFNYQSAFSTENWTAPAATQTTDQSRSN